MKYKEFLILTGKKDTEMNRTIWDIKQREKYNKKEKEITK